ncbi:MAG: TIGR03936 family radical SAM-associated protein [Firmicutes bacterium]|nr:TIGR03936 family radical SAM-associated protein [Bacillota bacterium]
MSNYVLKYSRDERVKYISHLDFIRTFHRAVRRADIPMSFSHGFNPHPIMTVAMPLSVGMTAGGEYMKIGFECDYSEQEIMDKLNESLPIGFKILAIKKVEGKELDFAKLDRAIYNVDVECNDTSLFDAEVFMQNKELKVMKKSKSGIKEADIRPYIYDFNVDLVNGNLINITMCLATGNTYNLKVDSVIEAMVKYTGGFNVEFFATHRTKILAGDEELL